LAGFSVNGLTGSTGKQANFLSNKEQVPLKISDFSKLQIIGNTNI